MEHIKHKIARTATEVHPLIRKRWSPRAFAERPISDEQLAELFEAASWAASAFNEQPWRYVYSHRGTDRFEDLLAALAPGNQTWAADAAVLFVSLYKRTHTHNGRVNQLAGHDTGMANAQLLLQAIHRDIYGHLMSGFDPARVVETLELDDDLLPVCMGALGYLGAVDTLPDDLHARELTPRARRPVADFVQKI